MLQLCRVTTADGLLLDGSWRQPDDDAVRRKTALLLIHGTGGNFYGAGILSNLADQALADGYSVLRINTRGHDLAASIPGPGGPVKGGAAFENVLECQYDISAWCEFLVEQGRQQIVLVGHSLGGVKAFWSQKLAPHPSVAGIVGLSPPRFVHRKFQSDYRFEAFRRDYAAAEQLVAAGKPETLMTVTQPLPIVITAGGFLEKYGPDDPLDYLPILPHLRVPKLVVLGSQSAKTSPAFDGLLDKLDFIATADFLLTSELIRDADINYRNDPAEPWRRISRWLTEATEQNGTEQNGTEQNGG